MTHLNEFLFSVLNAHANASATAVTLAKVFAEDAIWLVPLALLSSWLWGGTALRRSVVEATLAGALSLAIAQVFALSWYHPRPFAVGLGNKLIEHVADSSFPSDHGTLLAAVAVGLLMHQVSRRLGLVLAILWFPVAWSRIYLGVHFPADMLGGLAVGTCAVALVRFFGQRVVDATVRLLSKVHELALGPCIRRGWVKA